MRLITQQQPIMVAQAATGIGNVIDVSECDVIMLDLRSAASASSTTKVQGSLADAMPNFAAAATPANPWDYIQITPVIGGSALAGGTGLVLSGTDGGGIYIINVSGIKWLTLNTTARVAGTISAFVKGFSTGGVA